MQPRRGWCGLDQLSVVYRISLVTTFIMPPTSPACQRFCVNSIGNLYYMLSTFSLIYSMSLNCLIWKYVWVSDLPSGYFWFLSGFLYLAPSGNSDSAGFSLLHFFWFDSALFCPVKPARFSRFSPVRLSTVRSGPALFGLVWTCSVLNYTVNVRFLFVLAASLRMLIDNAF